MTTTTARETGGVGNDIRIAVLIPTYRRPEHLERLLIAVQNLSGPPPVHIIVAENDAERRDGEKVVEALRQKSYPFSVDCIIVEEKGLCNVRNSLLSRGLSITDATHFALIDDDEWPSPHWLEKMRDTLLATSCDIVGGPVESVFERPPPDWTEYCNLFRPEIHSDGVCDIIWGCNNAVISRKCLEATGPEWFSPTFNLMGGEDVDFFSRMKERGFRFAWSKDALVHEGQPPERARLNWVLKRGFRIGTSDMRIQLLRAKTPFQTVQAALKAGAGLAFHGAMLSILVLRKQTRANGIFSAGRATGKLYGLLNGHYNEYS
ncbi:glycosyltransferase [Rhizobiaceae bacterium BDR2-2]|uniref:Glycosyltransferase n=1 Tax=Ectorhizobium quercum TaxID=2965071 RepID=A0AAE3N1B2_9HYPH|nr:glycosyltransferase family 2 protein [Ectorhizobium quercum]MCX8998127.1 glycosyltransferase [Ectorhizobium quercum]